MMRQGAMMRGKLKEGKNELSRGSVKLGEYLKELRTSGNETRMTQSKRGLQPHLCDVIWIFHESRRRALSCPPCKSKPPFLEL